jgi:hypothetical protein
MRRYDTVRSGGRGSGAAAGGSDLGAMEADAAAAHLFLAGFPVVTRSWL